MYDIVRNHWAEVIRCNNCICIQHHQSCRIWLFISHVVDITIHVACIYIFVFKYSPVETAKIGTQICMYTYIYIQMVNANEWEKKGSNQQQKTTGMKETKILFVPQYMRISTRKGSNIRVFVCLFHIEIILIRNSSANSTPTPFRG